jgi:hypothetical protein
MDEEEKGGRDDLVNYTGNMDLNVDPDTPEVREVTTDNKHHFRGVSAQLVRSNHRHSLNGSLNQIKEETGQDFIPPSPYEDSAWGFKTTEKASRA